MADRGAQNEGRGYVQDGQERQDQEQLQPTEEEIKVIRATSREANIYRGIPGGVTFAALHRYVFRNSGRFSTLLAFSFGFVVGKASYQGVLTERILQLENSPIGDRIRERQRQQADYKAGIVRPPPTFAPTAGRDEAPQAIKLKSDYNESSPSDDQDNRKELRGLDENLRPDIDSGAERNRLSSDAAPEKKHTSYEELRRKSRMEDAAARAAPPTQDGRPLASYTPYDEVRPARSRPPPPPPPSSSEDWENQPIKRRVRRNQYGDIIED